MNSFIDTFHFIRPLFLLGLVPSVFLFISLLNKQKQSSEWQSLIAPHLLPHLLEGSKNTLSKWPLITLAFIWSILCVALAGPSWKKIPQPVLQDQSALVILFDLSPSMAAQDLKPSRLVRARLKLIDLLDKREEGLSALIAYAGEAHTVTPLTDDVETIKNLIPSLSPDTMPVRGSNPEMALEQAHTLLTDAGIAFGHILFITDGISPAANDRLRELYNQQAHKVTVWGFGSEDGAPIPLNSGGFARSKTGEIIVSKLDSAELNQAAIAMRAAYIPSSNDNFDIESVNASGNRRTLEQNTRESEREFDQWEEFGPWMVLLILPIAALSFRRGLLLGFALIIVLPFPTPGQAQDSPGAWQNLWKTPDQQAEKLLKDDAAAAAKLFTDPQRKASAHFRSEQYEEAATLFSQGHDARSLYNKGTALTYQGNYEEAIEAFDSAIALKANFEQAENNKRIAETLKKLEEQQEQQSENQDGDQSQQNENENSQENQQEQNQDQSQQKQEQNSQNQDSQQQDSQEQENQQQENSQQSEEQNQDSQSQQASAEEKQEEEKAEEDFRKNMQQAMEEEKEEEQDEQQAQAPRKEQEQDPQDDQEKNARQAQAMSAQDMEQSEEQQSLEQWLRKVPDDPGRLLRNKFLHEARQRQREFNGNAWSTSENDPDQRW